LRACAEFLSGPHGGDREAGCLEASARASLELIAELLASKDAPMPRGYKDACDKLVEYGVCEEGLAERLKEVFDVAERVRDAWSSLHPGDLDKARRQGADALRELADAFERLPGLPSTPASA